jgi:hypothetical protein
MTQLETITTQTKKRLTHINRNDKRKYMISTTIPDLNNTIEDFFNLNKKIEILQDQLFNIESQMFFCDQMMKAIQKIDSHKLQIECLLGEKC